MLIYAPSLYLYCTKDYTEFIKLPRLYQDKKTMKILYGEYLLILNAWFIHIYINPI